MSAIARTLGVSRSNLIERSSKLACCRFFGHAVKLA